MSNTNRASYTTIGFTVLIGIIAIVGTLVYIGGFRGRSNKVYFETYYDRAIGGLTSGSPVNFRGVRFGEVSDVSFVGIKYPDASKDDIQRIFIRMAIDKKAIGMNDLTDADCERRIGELVGKGLRATVSSNSITGLSRIEFDLYENEPPTKTLSWKPKSIYIPSRNSFMDTFSVAATKVMNQINSMDIESVWSNVNSSVAAVSVAAESVRSVLESRRGDIDQIIGNLNETVVAARDIALMLRQNPSLLVRERIPEQLPETRR